jgi:hypothetical protein
MTFSAWRLPRRQPLAASYDDLPGCFVAMCWAGSQDDFAHSPSVLRRGSHSGLPMVSQGAGGWRCLAVERLSEVELRTEAWHTEPRSPQQTCIDEIDFDADTHPEEDPQ